MALVISAVEVTGTATAYTVPTAKIAKVRLVNIASLNNVKTITIGNCDMKNDSSGTIHSSRQGQDNNDVSFLSCPPVTGFVRASSDGGNFYKNFVYFKEDHVLVAGETVSCNDAGATISYTIFEEDA